MSLANPRWGAPRIHGELLKLGIDIKKSSRLRARFGSVAIVSIMCSSSMSAVSGHILKSYSIIMRDHELT